LERLLTPLDSELAIIWTPKKCWKGAKQKDSEACKAKKNEKS
jgi:hypothetical protein